MDPSTFSKIQILASKDELPQYIDLDQLPARYGGNVKEDGLCEGGKIPEKYYQVERLLAATKHWPRYDVKVRYKYQQYQPVNSNNRLVWLFLKIFS